MERRKKVFAPVRTETGEWGLTAPAATALAALMTLVGAIVGALITGHYSSKAPVELEKIKFETGLIIRAIESQDRESSVKSLQFLAKAGLIPTYESRVMTLKESDIPPLGSFLREVAASRVSSFAYQTSPSEIEPGRREWRRIDDTHWTETYPSGKASRFIVRARTAFQGCAGTVIANEQETNFQILIPDKGCSTMALWFRRGQNQEWIYLQPMIDVK